VENLYLVLGSQVNGKPLLTVIMADNLVKEKGLNAAEIVRTAAKEIQGGGGGQAFYATAGGKNPEGLAKAIEKAADVVIKK
jgi:alanyl-tRNA synthetase